MSIYGVLFRNILFPAWEGIQGRKTTKYLEQLLESQWQPREQIIQRQQMQLKDIVTYAYRESRYYRERLDEAGANPEQCLYPDVWQKIPLLTKKDMCQYGDELRADAFRKMPVIIAQSSGSTGRPAKFVYNRDHYDRRYAAWMRADSWAGYVLGEKYWMLRIGVTALNQKRPPLKRLKERLYYGTRQWRYNWCVDAGVEELRALATDLIKFKPKTIFGFVSPLYAMARLMLKEGLQFSGCDGVILGGEKSYDWQKEVISKALNSPVFERYGCQEFCNIAAECNEHNGMHINCDGLYVEIVDDNGVPVPPGVAGNVVVTSLDNMAMPFIRYKLGDIGIMDKSMCPCGRQMPKLKSVLGREMDMLVTPEGKKYAGLVVLRLMSQFKKIEECQFVQESIDRLVLRIVPDNGFNKELLPFLETELRRYMGPSMRIEFQFVDSLERMKSNKYKMVVSKLNIL